MATTYKMISSVTVGGGGASYIEFTSIPATYTDLILVCSTRHSGSGSVADYVTIALNGSTGSITGRFVLGSGSSVQSNNGQKAGIDAGASATSSSFSSNSYYFPNYAGSTNKSWSIDYVVPNAATEAYQGISSGLYSNNSAITSIRLTPGAGTLVQYSTAFLYGIKNS